MSAVAATRGIIGLVIGLAALGYVLMGPVPAAIFSVFLVGGFIAWRLTTAGKPAAPDGIVVPYLLAVILFVVHVVEEYLTEFWVVISRLTGHAVPEQNFLLVAAFIGPILWLGALILFYLRTELGNVANNCGMLATAG